MTNDQLCSIIGIIGVLLVIMSLPFVIFRIDIAWITLVVGLILGAVALVNYDDNGF